MSAEDYIKAYTRGCSNETVGGEFESWMTVWGAQAAVRLAREEVKNQIVNVVKYYFDKGIKRYEECLGEDDSVSGYDRSNEFYWDGFSDCAQALLREIEKDNPK